MSAPLNTDTAVQGESGGVPAELIDRPDFERRLAEFGEALFNIPWIAERVLDGQQFNAYERVSDDPDDDPDDAEFLFCIGPVTNARRLFEIEGRDRAKLIEAALKVATEAFRERRPESAQPNDEAGMPDAWLHDAEWARVGRFFIYPREPDFYIGVAAGPNTFRDVDGISFTNIEAAIDHARWLVSEERPALAREQGQ